MARWIAQAQRWDLKTLRAEVRQVRRQGQLFRLGLGRRYLYARTVIYCPGADFQDLGIPGIARFWGRGLFHAALDDAPRWRGRTVAVVGGGEAAVHQALTLARHARRVYLLCRGDALKAHRLLLRRLRGAARIVTMRGTNVRRLHGQRRLEALDVAGRHGQLRLETDALFVLVGKKPVRLPFPTGRLPRGFFVAGDASGQTSRQVAVAAGAGMQAAVRCIELIEQRSQKGR
jgi:thioredoxin reductase (NADPH)